MNANLGRLQPRGRWITRQGFISPGWTVAPGPTQRAVEERDGERWYTVRPGDNLTRISAILLGDGQRYAELFELNRGARLDTLHVLVDPNLIWPGLALRFRLRK